MSAIGQPSEPISLNSGQIWIIEQELASDLFSLDRGAIARADVVLYDRALTPLLAELLPRGGYAEPLSGENGSAATLAPRAVALAAEGWNVVQLVEAGRARAQRFELGADLPGCVPLQVIAKTPVERYRTREAHLPALDDLIGGLDGALLTLVVGPFGRSRAAASGAFTANGLAG